jgi:hypothetical protein
VLLIVYRPLGRIGAGCHPEHWRQPKMQNHQPTHADLAVSIARLEERLDALDAKITPVSEVYQAAKVGGVVLKWLVGLLAGIAGIAAFFWGAPK